MKVNEQKNIKTGFTLLELLVVVLIIGILAAIALPQYQLARDKAEFIKYRSMVTSLRDAYNEYVLIHGNGTDDFNALSLTIPSDFIESYSGNGYKCVSNNDMFCCMSPYYAQTSALLSCGKKDLSVVYTENFFKYDGTILPRVGLCLAQEDNKRATKLCASLGTKGNRSNAYTPSGLIVYRSYTLK